MKILKVLLPYLYVLMVVFVVFHNTGYKVERMIETPYILYLLMAILGFMVIQSIMKQEISDEQ